MRVSVIIPTYNRAYILPEAVESVLNQTHTDFELIVVDDGSTDHTAEVLGGIKDSRIRVIRHAHNRGTSAAKNTGLELAKGELIATLDSDDLWKREKLELQVRFLDEHPQVAGVFSDLELIRGTQHVASMLRTYPVFSRLLRDSSLQNKGCFSKRELYICLLEEMPVKLQASVLRRDSVSKIDPFKEAWKSGEDWEFILRFARQNPFGYLDCALTVQRTLADSTLGGNKRVDASCLMERFIQEKQQLREDPEALAAVRRGIAHRAKELGWQFLNAGDRRNAVTTYWRGFLETLDFMLLARVIAAPVPRVVRDNVKRLQGFYSSSIDEDI